MSDTTPSFPPLFEGVAVEGGLDPFEKAVSMAALGCDSGTITHRVSLDQLSAAIVLAPESPLQDAMIMVIAAGLGFGDALGSLAPPEVGVHLVWPGGIRVNGAICGSFKAASSTSDPKAEPDWLVIGLTIPLMPSADTEGGDDPDRTTLFEEGCAEVDPTHLLESWSRHMLVWVNRYLDDGAAPLLSDWRARAHGLGEDVTLDLKEPLSGTFVGLDERGSMMLRSGEETQLLPLTCLLEGQI